MTSRTALLLLLLLAPAALADTVDTPSCRRELAIAGRLVAGIAARENSVKPGDVGGWCRLLRRNLPEMIKARNAMDR
jgi:hypothetical protein